MATTSYAASDYFEQAALEILFGYASYSGPTGLEISLHSQDPGETGSTANELTSGTDPGYARAAWAPNSSVSASDGAGWSIYPNSTITFTATGNWAGQPTFAGVYDNNGNFLFRAEIDDGGGTPFAALTNGQTINFASGQLKFKLS